MSPCVFEPDQTAETCVGAVPTYPLLFPTTGSRQDAASHGPFGPARAILPMKWAAGRLCSNPQMCEKEPVSDKNGHPRTMSWPRRSKDDRKRKASLKR